MLEEKAGDQNGKQQGLESFSELFEASVGAVGIETGEIVKGTIVSVDTATVTVDVGYKSEGMIPVGEFTSPQGETSVAEGDSVEVLVVSTGSAGGGLVLSFRRAKEAVIWKNIEEAFNSETPIEGTVIGKVKGGLSVDLGVTAFLPGSHVEIRPPRGLDRYVGETQEYAVLKFNRARGNVVVSRKVLLEKERNVQMDKTLAVLDEGVVLEGVVKNVTDYGAFVDVGGLDGLLHVTDMSYGRITSPSERVKPGDVIKVVVLKFDAEARRVSLGMKQLQEDPWETITDRLFPGSRLQGKVVSIVDYGAFVEVEEGIEGLVHVSEMSWTTRVTHPSKVVSVNDEVDVVVLGIDQSSRRVSLGMKQATSNPWEQLPIDHPVGTQLSGTVTSVTDFGFFVNVADGIDGLVHVSDMHWTKRVSHPSEVVDKGSAVEVMVLSIDVPNERLSLGLKQVSEDPWNNMDHRYPVGCTVQGKVTNVTDFGAFVEIEEGVEGMVHVSELSTERVEDPREFINVGEVVSAQVLGLDREEKKISLSLKSAIQDGAGQVQQAASGADMGSTGSAFNLGAMLSEQLQRDAPEGEAGAEPDEQEAVAVEEATAETVAVEEAAEEVAEEVAEEAAAVEEAAVASESDEEVLDSAGDIGGEELQTVAEDIDADDEKN
ncbi:MAG: 30S ribosomal protein S1 [Proteobacteria bacterium]|nr:30S ribosomal protein S1 [Pseudomonadota bacterium]